MTKLGLPDPIQACLFDLDGVLTKTAVVHAAAWKETFDAFLERREGAGFRPFDAVEDYDRYVDGMPRADGVRSFLASRGIELPEGSPDDPPERETVQGLGNRKNRLVLAKIKDMGVEAYEGSVRYVEAVRAASLRRAVVSSSANCRDVLAAAGIEDLFEVRIDGLVAAERKLPGKPRPDTFLAAAEALGVAPAQAVVFEDALAEHGGRAGRELRVRRRRGPGRAGRGPATARGGRRRRRPRRSAGRRLVITHPAYMVEPWCLRETELNLDVLSQSESVFALTNGHIGWRGNLDEGEPHGLPGTYLNGVFEFRPLPYAEAGYGYPESGQTIINVTNGKVIRLLVDDEPFDLRYGKLHKHERLLEFRTGLLHRTAEWTSPSGRSVRVRSTRLVSFTQRAVAAIAYEVEPLDEDVRIVIQSELVANEQLPRAEGDPRAAAVLESPLVPEQHAAHEQRIRLLHRTARSELRVGAAADHVVTGGERTEVSAESSDDLARVTITSRLRPGQCLRLEKLVAHGWSAVRSAPAVHDQVDAALAGATSVGWAGLVAEQRSYLDAFWARADVEVDGDAEIQQAARFALFHVMQAGGPRRGPRPARQGADGPGLRRALLLGHRDLCAAGAHLHRSSSRGAGPALAVQHLARGPGARPAAGVQRGGLPLAHHQRRRVLGVLARGHGGLPHQRRHRRCRGALRRGHGGRGLREGGRAAAAGGDGPAVAFPRPPRPPRGLPHRRGDRPGRVQRDLGRQRLHQPDGAA
ncbi:hypothetical protein GCM10020000_02000 [Streptomyces olivoverticillatus]